MPAWEVDGCRSCCSSPPCWDAPNLAVGLQALHEVSWPSIPMKRPGPDGYWAGLHSPKEKKTTQASLRLTYKAPAGGPWQPETNHRGLLDTLLGWRSFWTTTAPYRRTANAAMAVWSRCAKPERSIPAPPWRQGGKAARCCGAHPPCSGCSTIQPRSCAVMPARSAPGGGHPHHSGETPLAVDAGPFYKPSRHVEPPSLARLLCRAFHPPGSLLPPPADCRPDRRTSVFFSKGGGGGAQCSWPG